MALFDNASVAQIIAEQEAAYDEGLVEGYEADPNRLPVWWSTKTLLQLTNRQRAYFVGREVRLNDMSKGTT